MEYANRPDSVVVRFHNPWDESPGVGANPSDDKYFSLSYPESYQWFSAPAYSAYLDRAVHLLDELKKNDFSFQNVIDPDAIVSKFVIFGNSIFVNAGAILNSKAIVKDNVIINTSAILEHEVEINSHSHIGPKALICGRSKIGSNTFIGAGATIIDKINIGSNCVIGAGSVVINDVGNFEKVAGNPAKKI